MITEKVSIASHGMTVPAERFQPNGNGNGGAIVVAHGSDGMKEPWAELIREYGTELAGKGFAVVIPDYFASTGTVPGMGVFAEIPAKLSLWQQAVADTVAYAAGLPGMDRPRVGLLGFSLGGHICLRLRGMAQAVVEFFGPELGGIGRVSPGAKQVQIHHGTADMLVGIAESKNIAAELEREGVAVDVFAYEGAGHGFAGADPNNATARRSAKGRTVEFFGEVLG
ncbi:MAG: dienelactone hydrolase family protein [Bryobacterales bacterium]|nr:dienelactone hydrolase family protein [Bryobacterales bacterium]